MGHLSTHVLDTAHGRPAAGMKVTLQRVDADGRAHTVKAFALDADGRNDGGALLDAAAMAVGRWRLLFVEVAPYFRALGVALPGAAVRRHRPDRLRHRRRRGPLSRAAAGQPLRLQHLPRFIVGRAAHSRQVMVGARCCNESKHDRQCGIYVLGLLAGDAGDADRAGQAGQRRRDAALLERCRKRARLVREPITPRKPKSSRRRIASAMRRSRSCAVRSDEIERARPAPRATSASTASTQIASDVRRPAATPSVVAAGIRSSRSSIQSTPHVERREQRVAIARPTWPAP